MSLVRHRHPAGNLFVISGAALCPPAPRRPGEERARSGRRLSPGARLAPRRGSRRSSWRSTSRSRRRAALEMGATGCRADRSKCLTHDLWEELGNQIHMFLSSVTLLDVLERKLSARASSRRRSPAAADSTRWPLPARSHSHGRVRVPRSQRHQPAAAGGVRRHGRGAARGRQSVVGASRRPHGARPGRCARAGRWRRWSAPCRRRSCSPRAAPRPTTWRSHGSGRQARAGLGHRARQRAEGRRRTPRVIPGRWRRRRSIWRARAASSRPSMSPRWCR